MDSDVKLTVHDLCLVTVVYLFKEKITEIEERIRTVENNVSQVKDQAESYESEQQQIVAELQQRKRTFKEKQVHCFKTLSTFCHSRLPSVKLWRNATGVI